MLLPETRDNLNDVNEFLAEAKMTATMDHPRIVSFIGVAWDALSDLCVVLEFVDGGDLRTLLNKYEATHHPVGFDREKTTIALHVCHALTYLHSLSPPVIHRDLKSRNILLNQALEAKLTDFGISRERLDQTMTAGVGTSLWMAPEVMLGEKYDDKADMFSFGVVAEVDDGTRVLYPRVQLFSAILHFRRDQPLRASLLPTPLRLEARQGPMARLALLLVLALAGTNCSGVSAAVYSVTSYYSNDSCVGTPYRIYAIGDAACVASDCSVVSDTSSATNGGIVSTQCTSDYMTTIQDAFGNSPYLLVEGFMDTGCVTLWDIAGFLASGDCEGADSEPHIIAQLETTGSASLQWFNSSTPQCASEAATYSSGTIENATLTNHSCDGGNKWYSGNAGNAVDSASTSGSTSSDSNGSSSSSTAGNATASTSNDSGIGTGSVIWIILSAIAVLIIVVGVIVFRRRNSRAKSTETYQEPTAILQSGSWDEAPSGQTGLWNDDVITTARIPRDQVHVDNLISRGAFGEVYAGLLDGRQVAVKMLLPETRKSVRHVNDFLAEAKMTATMDHPRIVSFIGVAWNALSDLCVVLEYMDGGDLRTLLNKYEAA
ncbi:hypothetical protein BBJ28_00026430, partial [Nothophytophthora sp. Chile5]